jgi:hypothetical protein
MQNRPFRFGPIALTSTTTTNILNPGTTTGGVNSTGGSYANLRIILYHIRIVNKTNASHNYSLYLGATGANTAGTEVIGNATVIAANSRDDWVGRLPMDTGDFLVGGADANTALTIEGEGEIGVA